MFLSHTQESWYHLTTHITLAGQIASSTCLNTAAATKAGRKPWLELLEKQWRQMQRKARWKNTGKPDTGAKTGRDKVTGAEWWRHTPSYWLKTRRKSCWCITCTCTLVEIMLLPFRTQFLTFLQRFEEEQVAFKKCYWGSVASKFMTHSVLFAFPLSLTNLAAIFSLGIMPFNR